MKREINNVLKKHREYEEAHDKAEIKIKEVCDFDARLTFSASDGHLILNEITTSVAPLWCLNGKTKTNKLTEEEHYKFCV